MCVEGDAGDMMYFIMEGQLAVSKDGEHMGTLYPGNFFGETALVDRSRTHVVTVQVDPSPLP